MTPMVRDNLILWTRLAPPCRHNQFLPRPALAAQVREGLDFARLTDRRSHPRCASTTGLPGARS